MNVDFRLLWACAFFMVMFHASAQTGLSRDAGFLTSQLVIPKEKQQYPIERTESNEIKIGV